MARLIIINREGSVTPSVMVVETNKGKCGDLTKTWTFSKAYKGPISIENFIDGSGYITIDTHNVVLNNGQPVVLKENRVGNTGGNEQTIDADIKAGGSITVNVSVSTSVEHNGEHYMGFCYEQQGDVPKYTPGMGRQIVTYTNIGRIGFSGGPFDEIRDTEAYHWNHVWIEVPEKRLYDGNGGRLDNSLQ